MNDIKTVNGGPIEYKQASQTPIARARQHIAQTLAILLIERVRARDTDPNRALDLTHMIHDLLRIEGQYDGFTWSYPMSLRRLEAQEGAGGRTSSPEGVTR